MELISDHLGDLVMGAVGLVFAYAFAQWAGKVDALKKSFDATSAKLFGRLDHLVREFHEHRLHTENRVTRMETKIEEFERFHIKIKSDRVD